MVTIARRREAMFIRPALGLIERGGGGGCACEDAVGLLGLEGRLGKLSTYTLMLVPPLLRPVKYMRWNITTSSAKFRNSSKRTL